MTLKLNYPDKKPDNLCLAPFTMTRPDVRGWNSPCPFGAGDWVQPHLNGEQQWHADELNALRQKHLNNEQASECTRCYTEEKIGKPSLRELMLGWSDDDTYEKFIKNEKYLKGPQVIVYRSSNVCNLACRSCGGHDSNQFDKEGKVYQLEYGEHGNFIAKEPPGHVDMASYIPITDNVNRLEFFGGEPLLNITQFDILQYLVDQGRAKDISLMYNSNATNMPTDRLKDLWKQFKSVEISLSIDGIESRFEYLRYPGKWDTVLETVEHLQTMDLGIETFIHGNMTLSMQNVLNVDEILNWQFETFGNYPWIGFAEGPDYMNIRNFPDYVKEQITNVTNYGNKSNEDSIIPYMNLPQTETYGFKIFCRWMKRMDKYREQSFPTVFPELYSMIEKEWEETLII